MDTFKKSKQMGHRSKVSIFWFKKKKRKKSKQEANDKDRDYSFIVTNFSEGFLNGKQQNVKTLTVCSMAYTSV